MAVLKDYYCKKCDAVFKDRWSDDVPKCCGKQTSTLLTCANNFEWGGPRTFIHLRDEPFSSKSELRDWAKKKGYSLGESSEKVGGARNDMYANIGKLYSYGGSPKGTNPLYYTKRRYE